MRSSQKRSLLARGTKAVLPKLQPARCAKHTFVLRVKFPTAGLSGILKQKAYFEYAPALQHQKKIGMMKKN